MSEREIELLSALLALPWWLTLFATLFAGIAVFGGLWLTRRIESAAGRAVATAMLDHQHELDGKLESTRSELTKAQLRPGDFRIRDRRSVQARDGHPEAGPAIDVMSAWLDELVESGVVVD